MCTLMLTMLLHDDDLVISSSSIFLSIHHHLRCDLPSPDGCQEVCGWQAEGLTGR
jgi:hypothetical protein